MAISKEIQGVEERGRELYMMVYPSISLQNILKHAYSGIARNQTFPSYAGSI